MQKKVRLAIGAVGILQTAAVGIAVAPTAAQAATVAPHRADVALWQNCNYHGFSRSLHASSNHFGPFYEGSLRYSAQQESCVHQQGAVLYREEGGLTERARFRSKNNGLLRTTFQAGIQNKGKTTFVSLPNMFTYEICQALVANSNHNAVIFGPVCETGL
jgi:glycerol-3-phosphate dehydrogenase